MLRRSILILVVLAALLVSASPAFAQMPGAPGTYYVDTAYTGTEMGTQTQPYNTINEAVAAAQAQPYGGYIFTKQANGTWAYYGYIDSVYGPGTGTALSGPALFALLAVVSLMLVLGGWLLMKRSGAQARLA